MSVCIKSLIQNMNLVRSGHFPTADCSNQFIEAGYLSDVRKLVKQKADVNRQFAVVFVVCFITKQVEKL